MIVSIEEIKDLLYSSGLVSLIASLNLLIIMNLLIRSFVLIDKLADLIYRWYRKLKDDRFSKKVEESKLEAELI